MTAQGVKFTPEDIVLLNALAVKVRLSQNAARTTHLPRLAFLPGARLEVGGWRLYSGILEFLCSTFHLQPSTLVLREPTIAHEMWIEQATRYIKMDSDRAFDILHGYALAHPAEKLPDIFDPKRLIRKVFTWCARHIAHLTREQLSAAVDYVLFGADWTAGERGPEKSKSEVEVEQRKRRHSTVRLRPSASTHSPPDANSSTRTCPPRSPRRCSSSPRWGRRHPSRREASAPRRQARRLQPR